MEPRTQGGRCARADGDRDPGDAPGSAGHCLGVIHGHQPEPASLDGDEEDIWHCYNQRCTSETSIRRLKEDWSFDAFSKDGFGANGTDLLLKAMAYHLTLAMQKALNPKDRATVHTAATIRHLWFLQPAVVATHARELFLRLPREVEHGAYGQAARALDRLVSTTG